MLKLLYGAKGSFMENLLANVPADLDFVQSVSDLVSYGDGLSPALNVVANAFSRR